MCKEILNLLVELFGVEHEKMDGLKKFEYSKWDSHCHINLIADIEEKFNITLDPEEFNQIETADDFINKIETHFHI